MCTVNTYFVPQGHKARTWVMPQGPNSVITCRIDLKLGYNVSPYIADKMHFDSWSYDYLSGIYFKNVPGTQPKYAPHVPGAQSKCLR